MYMKIIFLNYIFTTPHIIDYNMIVSLLVCNWSAAMLSSAIYLKVERWKKTPIFDDDTDNHNEQEEKKHLGSSELSASFFVTWSTLLASLGGFYWKCQNFIFNFNFSFILHMAFKIFRDVIGYSQSNPNNTQHKESQISWYLYTAKNYFSSLTVHEHVCFHIHLIALL